MLVVILCRIIAYLMVDKGKKQVAHRWYLGGFASAGAACGTHPLDLLKVS